ncbi:DNA-processing protein DprA [Parendozoicomonas haliclonae]|uniref:Uncharacterized protein n=1 Tax=Parendozoicomonas haliclonae TaxID=1960125 RepID=A0A1X7AJA0_9GAMM|nr:DNA-processing protein DprA [Parendozoicomonas haliclonae]SMA46408.1 hypothetical protein EHSB41UT_02164 [Parendozoicomonas haliclonae]
MSNENNRQTEPLEWQQLEPWLLLFHISGLGQARYHTLLKAFSSPESILSASLAELKPHVPERIAKRILSVRTDADVQACLQQDKQWLREEHHHIVPLNSPTYPALLRAIHDPPVLLYLKGDPDILSARQVAVVGSRQPTLQASKTAEALASSLSACGVTVTSGLAIGVDGAAHRGALSGKGRTVAVMASGLDVIYPQRHTSLAGEIVNAGGVLVSEFALGTQPRSGHFPRRNRIISGLSVATLVVEAAVASGSLVTARFALEQGREVFAMPGSVNNPKARGCHALIRDGAILIENAEQLLDEIEGSNSTLHGLEQIRLSSQPFKDKQPECPEQGKVLEMLGYDSCQHDELVIATGFSSQKLSELLLVMELEGWVQSSPAGITRVG